MQQRQNDLLQQLADLKKVLTTMRKSLGVCAKPPQAQTKIELKPIQVINIAIRPIVNVNCPNLNDLYFLYLFFEL